MNKSEEKRRHDDDVAKIACMFLTVEDVAKVMNMSERTVYSYLMKGIIPGRKVGHRWYVYWPTLLEWLTGEEV